MEGMSTADFDRRIHNLNTALRIDRSRIAYPNKEYATCGLYYNGKYLFGIPQTYAPRWSLCGLNFNKLRDQKGTTKHLEKYGYLPEVDKHAEFTLLWRGYQYILEDLCRQGLIDRIKAQKQFGVDILPKRMDCPKNFIQMEIS